MLKKYDLVIYARGMNAAILLAEAVDKGLNVALVYENDCNNFESTPFVLTHLYQGRPFIPYIKAEQNSYKLSNAASNLIIQSKIIHYKATSLIEKVLFIFFNLVRKNKIKFCKSDKSRCLEYSTYKFSSDRMAIELLNFSREKGADVYQYCSLLSTQYHENQYYKINLFDKLSGRDVSLKAKSFLVNPLANKDILDKNRKPHDKNSAVFFTYPTDKINIKEVVIFDRKRIQIFIIPWFTSVYFKISGVGNISISEAIELIHKHLNFIQLEESFIENSGTKDRAFFLKEENVDQLIFYYQNKSFLFSFPHLDKLFSHSNRIILKILKHLNLGKAGVPFIAKTVLPGCNLGLEYHPLRIMEIADEKYDAAKQIIKSPLQFKNLFYRYGANIDTITDKAYEFYNEHKNMEKAWLMAEIWYCKNFEMCKTPDSFINTHTSLWMKGNSWEKELITKIFKGI